MASYTNQPKNTTVIVNQPITALTAWGSSSITWADAGIGWGDLKNTPFTKQTKNTSVMVNQVKN